MEASALPLWRTRPEAEVWPLRLLLPVLLLCGMSRHWRGIGAAKLRHCMSAGPYMCWKGDISKVTNFWVSGGRVVIILLLCYFFVITFIINVIYINSVIIRYLPIEDFKESAAGTFRQPHPPRQTRQAIIRCSPAPCAGHARRLPSLCWVLPPSFHCPDHPSGSTHP